MKLRVPGINVQWPWSELLVSKKKRIETRRYPLPDRLKGQWIAIIETPGRTGKKAGIDRARVIGLIKFNRCKQYLSLTEWLKDQQLHLVSEDDPLFAFKEDEPKYGWIVSDVRRIPAQPAPSPRGIVYSKPFDVIV